MTEPRQDWLDELLRADAAASQYPATPRFANPAAGVERTWGRRFVPRRFGVAIAALLIAVAVLLALPDTRSAIADFLGLRVQGERIEILPTPPAGVTPTALPTPQSIETIARPIAKQDIATQMGFTAQLPAGGEPQAYYALPLGGVRVLILLYPNYVLWETSSFLYGKGLPDGAILKELTIRDQPAYWIASVDRTVKIFTPEGKEVVGTQRTVAQNTLIWRGRALTYRLEADFDLEEAIKIAEGLP